MEDADRVAATQRLVPGGSGSGALDRLAALAARLLGASAAQVSLLTDEQTVAGGAGLAPGSVGGRNPVEESMCTVTVRSGGPLVVEDAARDERVARLSAVASGQVGAYLGVPLLDVDRRMVGALCVFDPLPRPWSAEDVAVLTELAAVAASELELVALSSDYDAVRLRLELAMDAAGIGSWDLDLTSGKLSWDDRLLEMFGYDADSFDGTLEAFYACVHPDDLAHVTREVQSAIDTSGDLEVQYRTVLPSGEIRWVVARGRCLLDSDGAAIRLVGAADDRTQERDGATRVARVLETMPAAFLSLDRDWRFSYVNAKAEELIGRPRDEVVGGIVWELFPDAVGSAFETGYRTALSTGRPVEFEEYYPPPLDRWLTVLAWPGPGGLSVYFHDGTARRRALEEAERARAESENAAARIDLLGEVSAQLAAEREPHGALERLVRLVVPALADWCVVVVLDEKGQPSDTAAWHGDPPMLDVVQQLARIEQTVQEWELGRTRVRWSNAGHLPPMVLHPDGAVTVLTGERSDLLLGIDPDSSRGEWEVEVRRGATVLLYTDGLVERRGESLSAGIARLHDILAELGEEPALDELCDDVLGRMLAADPQDDVAIVAVRLHPQDVPRPAEAGPARLPPHVPADPAG